MNYAPFFAIIITLHLIVNLSLSKEIIDWMPLLGKKLLFMGLLWCIPFIGATVVYKHLNLDWLQPSKRNPADRSGISTGLLELGAIFNPGTKYVIEAQQKERVEVKKEGEMHNIKNSSIIDINIEKNILK